MGYVLSTIDRLDYPQVAFNIIIVPLVICCVAGPWPPMPRITRQRDEDGTVVINIQYREAEVKEWAGAYLRISGGSLLGTVIRIVLDPWWGCYEDWLEETFGLRALYDRWQSGFEGRTFHFHKLFARQVE
ncbi:hypothetical protein LTR15_010473 [Elasticomyces elasticus]|nr:hypothetical protein LTR15_010473 [Elasticomyces elasticus]